MILKFRGLLTFRISHERWHGREIEDVFIGSEEVRSRLSDVDLMNPTYIVFEDHFWTGKLFDPPTLSASTTSYRGISKHASSIRGLSGEDVESPLPPLPFFVSGEDVLPILRQYLEREVILWVSDQPFSSEDFAQCASIFAFAERWQAAIMCGARALLKDSTNQRVSSALAAIIAVTHGPFDDIDSLHDEVNDVLLKYSQPDSRTQTVLKAFNAAELFSVGDLYLIPQKDSPNPERPDPSWAAAAIPFLTKAVELQPESAEYVFRLFEAVVWSGNIRGYSQSDLMDMLNRAIQLDPDNDHYLDTRAGIHETLGDTDEAIADRLKAKAARQQSNDRFVQSRIEQQRAIMEENAILLKKDPGVLDRARSLYRSDTDDDLRAD
jgi:tetratricopeptide (TPR) repeat protein